MVEEKIDIEGLIVFNHETFCDHRGYFMELYNELRLNKAIHEDVSFVQDNISNSHKNVVRGLHFQAPPFAQGKLVKVLKGKIMDIVVDIRKESVTYGKHLKIELSEQNHTQLWIPEGFAHGYYVMTQTAEIAYKCSDIYHPEDEQGIRWDDSDIGIEWPGTEPVLSERDINLPILHSLNLNQDFFIEEKK